MMGRISNGSIFELDGELDFLLEEIQQQAEAQGEDNVSPELITQFQGYCDAFNQKVDRIGSFLLTLGARSELPQSSESPDRACSHRREQG